MRAALALAIACGLAASSALAQTPLRSRSWRPPADPEPIGPTFNKEVVRILQDNCQVCHHPGEVAPFSLMDYNSARLFGPFIKAAVQTGYMPPWKPVVGSFANERGLELFEIDTIAEWVDNEFPEGDPADLPEPLAFSDEWTLGEPDLVLQMPEYRPGQQLADDYRCFSIPTGLTEGKQVEAVEVRPGNRQVVHHLILFPDPLNQSAALEEQQNDGQPGYTCYGDPGFDSFDGGLLSLLTQDAAFLGGWAPGNRPQVLPEGIGQRMSPGGSIAVQIHYHPDGTPQVDSTRVGLHFRDEPAEKELIYLPLVNQDFEIPAGAQRHVVTQEFTLPFGLQATIYSLLPHMHLLGREIQMEVTIAGRTETIIRIDDWDFDWQDTYWLKEPLFLPSGSSVKLTAVYDNSAENPRNPNSPPIPVRWGDGTNDEMALIFVGFTLE